MTAILPAGRGRSRFGRFGRGTMMIQITTLGGEALDVDESQIILIAGPYPHDAGPRSYVYGPAPAALVTAEDPRRLADRLGVKPALAVLTRPDATPVWIKGAAVGLVRAPTAAERQEPGEVNAVLMVGPLHQSVRETIDAARAILDEHGGHV